MAKFVNILLILLMIASQASAHFKVFYDKHWRILKDEKDMAYYRVITKDANDSTIFYLEDFYANGNKYMTGRYKTTHPEYLVDYRSTIYRDGLFTYYHDNGTVCSSGQYKQGCFNGEWKHYYSDGKLEEVGEYLLGANKGKKLCYYENGVVSSVSEYTLDFHLAKKETFDTTGKLKSSYTYEGEKIIDSFISLETKSSQANVVYEYVEMMPQPTYDVYKFLAKKMKYPKDAIEQKIKARIFVHFVVDTEGYITNVETVHPSGSESMRLEAIRVVSMLKPWKPGSQNGKLVRVFYSLPITFKLP